MKSILRIASITFTISMLLIFSSPSSALEWYEGGNLHSESIKKWTESTYSNRLATSGDWFINITKKFNPSLKKRIDSLPDPKYINTLKKFATELEACVSEITKDKRISNPNDRVAELASLCYVTMYGVE